MDRYGMTSDQRREEGLISILESWPADAIVQRLEEWASSLEATDGDPQWVARLRSEAAKRRAKR